METTAKKIASFRVMENEEIDLELVAREHADRPEAEAFARDRYRRAYGAEIQTFARELLVLRSSERDILSCVGLNMASQGPLYLEQYLDSPLEEEIGRAVGKRVDRARVAEIGTLATGEKGLSRLTMISLTGIIVSRGIDYIAFTGIKSVRNTLELLGMPLRPLTKATPDRLEGGAGQWGSYYSAAPEVVFLDVREGFERVKSLGQGGTTLPEALAAMVQAMVRKSAALQKAA